MDHPGRTGTLGTTFPRPPAAPQRTVPCCSSIFFPWRLRCPVEAHWDRGKPPRKSEPTRLLPSGSLLVPFPPKTESHHVLQYKAVPDWLVLAHSPFPVSLLAAHPGPGQVPQVAASPSFRSHSLVIAWGGGGVVSARCTENAAMRCAAPVQSTHVGPPPSCTFFPLWPSSPSNSAFLYPIPNFSRHPFVPRRRHFRCPRPDSHPALGDSIPSIRVPLSSRRITSPRLVHCASPVSRLPPRSPHSTTRQQHSLLSRLQLDT